MTNILTVIRDNFATFRNEYPDAAKLLDNVLKVDFGSFCEGVKAYKNLRPAYRSRSTNSYLILHDIYTDFSCNLCHGGYNAEDKPIWVKAIHVTTDSLTMVDYSIGAFFCWLAQERFEVCDINEAHSVLQNTSKLFSIPLMTVQQHVGEAFNFMTKIEHDLEDIAKFLNSINVNIAKAIEHGKNKRRNGESAESHADGDSKVS